MTSTVSALVSLYNSEKYLKGRLDDLLAQTLYAQQRLEIVCVNAGSTDGTRFILREYLEKGIPLQIITSLREGMYSSLERAIALATGDYVTIANADDRLAPNALERLVDVLDTYPDVGLVYADAFVTAQENVVWGSAYELDTRPPYTNGKLEWIDFDPLALLRFCYIGQAPLWRKALGGLDSSYLLAGDYEMALRLVAQGVRFQHIAEPLGIFKSGGMGMGNQQQSAYESKRAVYEWRGRILERYGVQI